MSINGCLSRRYDEWKKDHPKEQLIRQGLVCENIYTSAKPRIVLLGREVNALGNRDFELLKFLRRELEKGNRGEKFKMSAKQAGLWAYGILTGFQEDYHQLDLNRNAALGLKSIGWTNLSKIAGGGKADLAQVRESACNQLSLWKDELKIMNPEVILCSGTGTHSLMATLLGLPQEFLLYNEEQRRKINYSKWDLGSHECLCVDFFHHADRRGYAILYRILREVFDKFEKNGLFTWI